MAKVTGNSSPHKNFTEITQVGLKAYNLATQFATQIGGRLAAAIVTGLATDLSSFGAVIPAAQTAKGQAAAATATQNSALETGYQMVTAVRLAVSRKTKDASIRKGYGVGTRTNRLVVKDVKDALQTIVTRATANAAEALAYAKLSAADLTALTNQIASIDAADQAQEKARASAPQTTKQRNATARRILDAVNDIAGAGVVAFMNNATERALFEALVKKAK